MSRGKSRLVGKDLVSLYSNDCTHQLTYGLDSCLIKYEGQLAVLKSGDFNDIERRAAVLTRLKGGCGLPKIKKVLRRDDEIALVRDFVKGIVLSDYLGRFTGKMQEDVLDQIKYCHKKGVAGLDIYDRSILVHRERASLFNFGDSVFAYEDLFEEERQQDLQDFKDLQKDYGGK